MRISRRLLWVLVGVLVLAFLYVGGVRVLDWWMTAWPETLPPRR